MVDVAPRGEVPYIRVMRWDSLFSDLESQLHSVAAELQEGEIRDRTRSEQSRITLVQRLLGQVGCPVAVTTRGGRVLTGELTTVGAQWVALTTEGRSVIVPMTSVQGLRGLGRGVGQPLRIVEARLGLGSALRELSRNRVDVALWLGPPPLRRTGVIERVGADFLELGLTSPEEERRPAQSRDALTVPFAAIDTLDSVAAAQ